jgi:hypothetical protein
MKRFSTWKEAHHYAVLSARRLNREVGIWHEKWYDDDGFTVRSLPLEKNRYGNELRCEVVRPGDPL